MADRAFAPCCDAGIDNATAVNLGAVAGCRGALLHCIRDRATSHGELPQLEQRSDISCIGRFNVACTCCHPTGLRDHQLPAHARTAERYLVRRHLTSLHNERVSARLSRCGCRLTCLLADLWEIPALNCGAKNSGSHSTRPTIAKAWV